MHSLITLRLVRGKIFGYGRLIVEFHPPPPDIAHGRGRRGEEIAGEGGRGKQTDLRRPIYPGKVVRLLAPTLVRVHLSHLNGRFLK